MKYTWEFDGNAELWGNATFDTIQECIEDAKQTVKDNEEDSPDTVYIGETNAFVPSIDGETVLDQLSEDAADFAGEVGADWDAYDRHKRDELEELSDALTSVLTEWLKKYGRIPNFYSIENVKPYQLYKDGENRA